MDPGPYRDPAVYDILHTPGTAREVDGLERIRHLHGPAAGAWLEPACGTGRYLRVLAGRGRPAWGFDRDPAMVAYARRRRPTPEVRVADLTHFAHGYPRGSVGFAFTPINSIRHLETGADLQAHLAEMARVLRPDGIYAVGLSPTDYEHEEPTEDVWEARRGGCRVRQVVQYLPPAGRGPTQRFETVVSHILVDRGGRTERLDDTYRLRAYDERQWTRAVGRSPLREIGVVDEVGRDIAGLPLAYGIRLLALRQV